MARRKSVCVKWTVALVLVLFSSFVFSRPQELHTTSELEETTENTIRHKTSNDAAPKTATEPDSVPSTSDTSRNVKSKTPVIGESIKMVANQLLDKPQNKTSDTPVVPDTRIPPKLKTQIAQKLKVKTRHDDGIDGEENSHAGIAVPVSVEELESENMEAASESSTTHEGISTWILVSNPANKESTSGATEPTKIDEKKQKPNASKNKNKRPQNNKVSAKRPIIGSTNKSDLVAGGSAINENVYNKLKDTVLSNVQKNKNNAKTTTVSTTTAMTSESPTTTVKKINKKNKNKQKLTTTTTEAAIASDSAILPMEAKEQEIELEISTPATTTKKPKRSSTRKKTKTKKRKTAKPKQETTTAVTTQVKTANKTKSTKLHKKPSATDTGPITTQIYNYLSREVMPSVGVGVIGLAGLLGIAGYFLYPFTGTPVRRTFEVDKKDDIYKHNAEEYANDGNGQPEEEMLGTVLAGMPATTKEKYNPYSAQTTHVQPNRYTAKKEQDIRYRHVTNSYGTTSKYGPKYNVHYQQKTGLAHGAVYPEPINYHYQYEGRHSYSTEKPVNAVSYSPYAAVEPIYAAPQVGSSAYGSDSSGSVVYGVKPAEDADFKPVYPYDPQYHSETTTSPVTYSPTSMYLGSNSENAHSENQKYDDQNDNDESVDNKFVVGSVPKEFSDSATPAVVPEHGPRNLRKRRNIRKKRGVVGSIEELLKNAKENKENEIFISNEIDDTPNKVFLASDVDDKFVISPNDKDVYTVYAASAEPNDPLSVIPNTNQNEVVESVSTLPLQDKMETEAPKVTEDTTKSFKVYEVFNAESTQKNSPIIEGEVETSTVFKSMNTETTTEQKFETTSTNVPPTVPETTKKPRPTDGDIITYPPSTSSGGGFFDFLKRLVEFKYRLGLSILQTTSDNLNRYLRSFENAQKKSKSH
ncbi:uncharacterized protein LOC121734853 [Aricia agestis]|uniref:uncharacterized protein LOC121734853 n=1 Tax=Aricia agestis TaxID=91739 RepID=UPI001C202441|nr:uncharacterized protein LOC121734853 [Aricia agestis]